MRSEYLRPTEIKENSQFKLGDDVFTWKKVNGKIQISHLRYEPKFSFDVEKSRENFKQKSQ